MDAAAQWDPTAPNSSASTPQLERSAATPRQQARQLGKRPFLSRRDRIAEEPVPIPAPTELTWPNSIGDHFLVVVIKSASGLEERALASTDPHVKVSLLAPCVGAKPMQLATQSTSYLDRTTNPLWEQSLPLPLDTCNSGSILQLEVLDRDFAAGVARDYFVGQIQLNLADVLEELRHQPQHSKLYARQDLFSQKMEPGRPGELTYELAVVPKSVHRERHCMMAVIRDAPDAQVHSELGSYELRVTVHRLRGLPNIQRAASSLGMETTLSRFKAAPKALNAIVHGGEADPKDMEFTIPLGEALGGNQLNRADRLKRAHLHLTLMQEGKPKAKTQIPIWTVPALADRSAAASTNGGAGGSEARPSTSAPANWEGTRRFTRVMDKAEKSFPTLPTVDVTLQLVRTAAPPSADDEPSPPAWPLDWDAVDADKPAAPLVPPAPLDLQLHGFGVAAGPHKVCRELFGPDATIPDTVSKMDKIEGIQYEEYKEGENGAAQRGLAYNVPVPKPFRGTAEVKTTQRILTKHDGGFVVECTATPGVPMYEPGTEVFKIKVLVVGRHAGPNQTYISATGRIDWILPKATCCGFPIKGAVEKEVPKESKKVYSRIEDELTKKYGACKIAAPPMPVVAKAQANGKAADANATVDPNKKAEAASVSAGSRLRALLPWILVAVAVLLMLFALVHGRAAAAREAAAALDCEKRAAMEAATVGATAALRGEGEL
ncbi:hypothetical protein HYH03_002004 [Edaphochlamys debaryana]|uniref:C2 domain-containing protein n=1 Tax=Edaphochlamys debaryana TaxID=47281 RepID=A0A835YGD0_9CHLO|nr:hypothetical protein HYH03_002004 [Edaphochlamys debaryana]|eukprot:KAG2500436.1 hypothetical protein HYH03_002004 [Edaphochlamys debaryana]